MIFDQKLYFCNFTLTAQKKVFSHLQVYTIYLVNYYIRKLAHESKLFLCSKLKIVKSKFLTKKLPKHVNVSQIVLSVLIFAKALSYYVILCKKRGHKYLL